MSVGWIAVKLILLHAPDGVEILLNPDEVVSMRGPRSTTHDKLLTHGARCLINTSDGKYITVRESCADVTRSLADVERKQ